MKNQLTKNDNINHNQYYEILPYPNRAKSPKIDIQDVQKLGVEILNLGLNVTILTGFIAVKTLNFLIKTALNELQKEPKMLSNNVNNPCLKSNCASKKELTKIVTTTTTITEISYL